MSDYLKVIKKSTKIHIESLRDDIAHRKDKNFFWPTGTQVYVGRQGSGKTISAVKHIHDLKKRYPRAVIVSNVDLKYFQGVNFTDVKQMKFSPIKNYIRFQTAEDLELVLTKINNGFNGVIYLIDEIHMYFNALDSKNVPMYVFTEISQQRKQRKLIVGTSQLFLRMAKPLREQCDNLIVCNSLGGFITRQKAYDGMTLEQDYDGSLSGDLKRTGWFFHNRYIRNSFDTYQKVVSGSEQYEQMIRLMPAKEKRGFINKR